MTKDTNPQTRFTGMKKTFKVRFAFGHSKRPMEGRPSKTTYMYQSCLLYKQYDVFRSKKNFISPFHKKIEFLFPPCRVRSLLLSKPSFREERSKKEQILLKQKINRSKFQSHVKKLREKYVFGF